MRVLIVAANQEQKPDPVVPLGALMVAGAARAAGHEVQLFDACFAGTRFADALAESAAVARPEVVGVSMRNVDNAAWPNAISYLDHHRRVVEIVRESVPGACVVLGGSAFSLFPAEFMQCLGADYGVVGEGEDAFVELLARLNAAPTDAPGRGPRLLSSRAVDGTWLGRRPAYELADLGQYFQRGGAIGVQSKRGCAFGCTFCTYPQLEGTRVRTISPATVVDGIEGLYREHEIDHFFIVDNVFNGPPAHAAAVCDELIRRQLPIHFTAYCTPAGLDRELADKLARAGCTSLDLGTDAAAPATLASLGKPFTVETVRAASAACRTAGLKFCHSLILGGPDETWDTLAGTVRVIEECAPTAVTAMLGVRLHRDTALAVQAARAGWVRPEDIGLSPIFYVAEPVRDGLQEFAAELGRTHPNWIFPGLESGSRSRVEQRMRQRGVKGPLWEWLPQRR